MITGGWGGGRYDAGGDVGCSMGVCVRHKHPRYSQRPPRHHMEVLPGVLYKTKALVDPRSVDGGALGAGCRVVSVSWGVVGVGCRVQGLGLRV